MRSAASGRGNGQGLERLKGPRSGLEASGELRTKRLPAQESLSTGSSFESSAKPRCEVEKKKFDRDEIDELLRLVFQAERAALVPC